MLKTVLNNKPLLKNSISGFKNSAGRNSSGKITIYNRGGGHKKKKRKINFLRETTSLGIVISLEYDPNRSSYIASIYNYLNKSYYYILLPDKISIGDIIQSGVNSDLRLGNSLPLYKIPVGSYIHNIAKKRKSIFTRSAGTYSIILEKNEFNVKIKLRSGEIKSISKNCFATIGVVSNEKHSLKILKKAGRSRWLNNRPKVRGVAMNPVDHPHGGGEGKTSGGKIQLTPWGLPTKNKPTKKIK